MIIKRQLGFTVIEIPFVICAVALATNIYYMRKNGML